MNPILAKSYKKEHLKAPYDFIIIGSGIGGLAAASLLARKGKKVLVEFISANPTGPIHIGNARGGPLGDVIASLLDLTGHQVTREFLVNDIGGQVQKLERHEPASDLLSQPYPCPTQRSLEG